jgi:hypothetical protein
MANRVFGAAVAEACVSSGRSSALALSRAAVLAVLFVLAWHRAWKFVVPGFNVGGTPHNHLGQAIRAAEVLAVIASLSFVIAGPAPLSRLLRGRLGTLAALAFALAGLAGASSLWALHPGLAVVQGMHLLIWAAFALVVAWARVPPQRMATAFVLGLLVHAAVGFAQVIVQNHIGLTVLGELRIPPDDPLKSVRAGDSLFLRAYGLSPHPNVLAGHLAIGLILCWGLAAGMSRVGRALVAVAWAIVFACLLLTFSRSGLLAAVLGIAVAAAWLTHTGTLARPVAGPVWKIVGVAAVMLAVFAYAFNRYVANRWMDALLGSDIRLVLMNVALKLIAEHPLAGVGAGNFSLATRAATQGQTTYDAVHNVPLLIDAELGLAGLAAASSIATVVAVVGYHRWRARSMHRWHGPLAGSLVALATVGLFDHYLWTHPQGGLMGAWLVGWWLTNDSNDTSSA